MTGLCSAPFFCALIAARLWPGQGSGAWLLGEVGADHLAIRTHWVDGGYRMQFVERVQFLPRDDRGNRFLAPGTEACSDSETWTVHGLTAGSCFYAARSLTRGPPHSTLCSRGPPCHDLPENLPPPGASRQRTRVPPDETQGAHDN